MSILDKVKQQEGDAERRFVVVCGTRLAGKTTLAGTLPGRTILLQAKVLESGSRSAVELSRRLETSLSVLSFGSLPELAGYLKELGEQDEFDNVYVDGVSALSEMKFNDPRIQTLRKKDNFAAFRELGEETIDVVKELKALTYGTVAFPKHVFVTAALKADKGDVIIEAKGQMLVTALTRLGDTVITAMPQRDLEGGAKSDHYLITKSQDCWPGRIDGLLPDQNPGTIEPANLGALFQLIEGKSV